MFLSIFVLDFEFRGYWWIGVMICWWWLIGFNEKAPRRGNDNTNRWDFVTRQEFNQFRETLRTFMEKMEACERGSRSSNRHGSSS